MVHMDVDDYSRMSAYKEIPLNVFILFYFILYGIKGTKLSKGMTFIENNHINNSFFILRMAMFVILLLV